MRRRRLAMGFATATCLPLFAAVLGLWAWSYTNPLGVWISRGSDEPAGFFFTRDIGLGCHSGRFDLIVRRDQINLTGASLAQYKRFWRGRGGDATTRGPVAINTTGWWERFDGLGLVYGTFRGGASWGQSAADLLIIPLWMPALLLAVLPGLWLAGNRRRLALRRPDADCAPTAGMTCVRAAHAARSAARRSGPVPCSALCRGGSAGARRTCGFWGFVFACCWCSWRIRRG